MSVGEGASTFLTCGSQAMTATKCPRLLVVLRVGQEVSGAAAVAAEDGVVLPPVVHHGLFLAHVFLKQTGWIQCQVELFRL